MQLFKVFLLLSLRKLRKVNIKSEKRISTISYLSSSYLRIKLMKIYKAQLR